MESVSYTHLDVYKRQVVAGIINWLIRILICGGCLVGVGILLAFIEIKIAGLYKNCLLYTSRCV